MDQSTEQRVAQIVGRDLDPSELDRYPSFDALPPSVADLVAIVAMKGNTVLAAKYLFGRVRATVLDLEERVQLCMEEWASRWTPSDEVAVREIISRDVRTDRTTSEDMDLVAVELAEKDFALACKYILHRVPNLHLFTAMAWVHRLLDPHGDQE